MTPHVDVDPRHRRHVQRAPARQRSAAAAAAAAVVVVAAAPLGLQHRRRPGGRCRQQQQERPLEGHPLRVLTKVPISPDALRTGNGN